MNVKQIKDIIEKGENQEVEFKETFHSQQTISKVISAFANTLGGILIFGVKDSGEIIGLKGNLDEIQQKISDSNQTISPNPLIQIESHTIESKSILVVIIQRPADSAYYTHTGAIHVRIGSTTRRLEGQTQLEFLRNRQILSFDETYEQQATIKDLDKTKIQAYLKNRSQEKYLTSHSIEEFLLSNKLATKNGELKIKNSAILLFAKNPIRFFPQSEIKLALFAGKEPIEVVTHKLLQEDLINSIDQSLSFTKTHMDKSIQMQLTGRRIEKYEFPLDVIREAIVNAIAHRDYFSKDAIQIYIFEDRLEITNPGSLPRGLTKELFGTISVQRNPITYRFLRDYGYVEGLGLGVPRMRNTMRQAGLKDPDFIFTESFFRTIIYNTKGKRRPIEKDEDLNDRQKNALKYLKKNKSLKSQTYSEINEVSKATAVNEINEMIKFGYIKKEGAYRGAYYILVKK